MKKNKMEEFAGKEGNIEVNAHYGKRVFADTFLIDDG